MQRGGLPMQGGQPQGLRAAPGLAPNPNGPPSAVPGTVPVTSPPAQPNTSPTPVGGGMGLAGTAGSGTHMMGTFGPMGGVTGADGGPQATISDLQQQAAQQQQQQQQQQGPAFDLSSDFPALGPHSRGGPGMNGPSAAHILKGGAPGMPQNSEFRIQSEDFPALGGGGGGGGPRVPGQQQGLPNPGGHSNGSPQGLGGQQGPGGNPSARGGLAHRPDNDRYGLLGLLDVIRLTEADVNMLSLGTDLTTLGLNLNANGALHTSFSSPWTDMPPRQVQNDSLPACYRTTQQPVRASLMAKYSAETLFWIFYSTPKDLLQAASAKELFARDWRYHNDTKLWFTRAPADEYPNSFIYFDINTWAKKLAQPQDMKALANSWELMPPDVSLPQ